MLYPRMHIQSINQALGPPWVFAQPWVHMPRTKTLHLTLSLDILLMSVHASFLSAKSLLRVFLCLPFFLFPCGSHVSACRAILFSGFLSVCPIHLHFLSLISVFNRTWSA